MTAEEREQRYRDWAQDCGSDVKTDLGVMAWALDQAALYEQRAAAGDDYARAQVVFFLAQADSAQAQAVLNATRAGCWALKAMAVHP